MEYIIVSDTSIVAVNRGTKDYFILRSNISLNML